MMFLSPFGILLFIFYHILDVFIEVFCVLLLPLPDKKYIKIVKSLKNLPTKFGISTNDFDGLKFQKRMT